MTAIAGLFDSFISRHNLSLNFENDDEISGPDTSKAAIHMIATFGCRDPVGECSMFPLSLSQFEHYRTVLFTRSASTEIFKLPSLTAPFSDPAAETTFSIFSLCLTIVLVVVKGKSLNIVSVYTLSGPIGESLVMSRNRTFMLIYSFWLLLAGFMCVTYTNILQSYVVVPGIHFNDLSFEDMIEENYSFESAQWKWIKDVSIDRTYDTFASTGIREKQVSERVSKMENYWVAGSDPGVYLEYYSREAKRALIDSSANININKLIYEVTDWDVIVGKEKFFNVPIWWSFLQIERASLLASSVEMLKESGFLQYFLQLSDAKLRELVIARSINKDFTPANAPAKIQRTAYEGSSASLDDALVSECFVLFMYGMLVAVVVFLADHLRFSYRATWKAW